MPSQGARAPWSTTQEYRKEQFLITNDPARLDVDSIHGFLSKEFWDSEGIARDVVERSIRGSLCFGVYDGQRQIGFARVVTDGATFAYLCDDYILEDYRGKGLGKWLMECILSHPDLQGLHRWVVVTRDIRLYTKVGFTPLKEPETYLEMVKPSVKPQT
ncbi:MAG TPA: GNAT family N-acetyltransferase [Candidatus Acidoferrales bacterium]|nr:GNAT family N-acetyltransferase [Candidatus Acidoferrales bacterium]